MKSPARFARVHYTIETDSLITHEFILNLIRESSETKSESDKYAKIANTEVNDDKQIIEVFSTEKIYLVVHNKNLKAKITINEKN